MERRPHGAPASSPACAAPRRPHGAPAGMERRRPRRPAPHRGLHGAPAAWSAGVLAGLRRTVGRMERLPHGAPASSPACAAPSAAWSTGRMERRRPRRPAPHRGLHGASAAWSAGVLAGLRRPLRSAGSLVPTAPRCRGTVGRQTQGPSVPPAVAGGDAGAPWGRCPVRASAAWSAGVLAGLRRTLRASGSLVPTSPRCRGTVVRQTQGPSAPPAVAGGDAGAPWGRCPVRASAAWSAGVLAGLRRPLRPAGSLVPTAPRCRGTVVRQTQGPFAAPAVAGGDAGAPWGQWPVRAPAAWSAGVLAGLRRTVQRIGLTDRESVSLDTLPG